VLPVWRRRSEEEIAAVDAIQRRWWREWWMAFALAAVFGVLVWHRIETRGARSWLLQPLVDHAAIVGLMTAALVIVVWMIAERSGDDRTRLCPKCDRVGRPEKFRRCDCGAATEPIDHWEWIESERDSEAASDRPTRNE